MATIIQRLGEATACIATVVGDREISAAATAVCDDELIAALSAVADARRALDVVGAALSSEIDRRSRRELGYSGLAQRTGHRTATTLIQSVTGQSATEVRRATEAGHDLAAASPAPPGDDPAPPDDAPLQEPWFAVLTGSLTTGRLSREQYDAIRRGLGEPPVGRYPDADRLRAMWREAASMLIEEASDRVVEDLRAAARLARDTLDPIGTRLRFEERFERRSFTMWVDENGQQCARIRFDDDAAAWVRTLLGAALRPRRGPRFVDAAGGAERGDDTRTNEQLQYDTVFAVLKTGAQADPAQAFGDRQPGVRIIVTRDDLPRDDAVGWYEETGQAVPDGVVQTYLCSAGALPVVLDHEGSPLDVGRERRLFTRRQRIAMAVRDGGCLACGAEPSRCEAHHLDHWHEHHGRTDLADGVLLCRNCHMRLHNLGWRVIRDETGYWLRRPDAPPRLLRSRSLLRFAPLASDHPMTGDPPDTTIRSNSTQGSGAEPHEALRPATLGQGIGAAPPETVMPPAAGMSTRRTLGRPT
ncbi:DUF222 domain-containing protein [Microbacterium sp. AZCO]|uniref:DUF222 domain-containing protein n=1 Tax=Microbacterium sp. AZCO TaxID=3142976 RepID=UPI0031F3E8B0